MKVRLNPVLMASLVLGLAPGALAQNDECTAAISLGGGAGFMRYLDTTNATDSPEPWSCSVVAGKDLWYEYTALSDDLVNFSACSPNFDTVLEILDGQSCSPPVSLLCSENACGTSGVLSLYVTSGRSYFLRVGGLNGGSGAGRLIVQFTPPPNDACAGALPLLDGITPFDTTNALTSAPAWSCGVGFTDIWYTFAATGTSVDIRTCGTQFEAVIELFDGSCGALTALACDRQACGTSGAINVPVNPGRTYYLRVGGGVGDFGPGVLNVQGAGPILLGGNYCVANPNSTGAPAGLTAMGSNLVASNSVELTASGMPPSTFGFFLTGMARGFSPNVNGSQGNLCLSGPIGRYVGAGEIKSSGALGEFSLAPDLSRTPTPTGFVAVLPGELWHYQAWFRDSSSTGVTSNFTNGLSVQFL